MSLNELIIEREQGGVVKSQTLIRATEDMKLWRVMIARVLKGGETLKRKLVGFMGINPIYN